MYKYKNIRLTDNIEEANCVTHSGKFHVDDVISTVFIGKIIDEVTLIRIPNINDKNLTNKLVYDIGLGEFDHHQKNRNGKRENGIYYSSIGLLWKKFGKEYLEKIKAKNIEKTFEYMDNELIQYIDATDNMQFEYLKSKTSPDFVKLYNPNWNEDISENEGFINAIRMADEFWNIYIKHAIAEVEATEIISEKMKNCKECYLILEKEMPYKRAVNSCKNNLKYIIFKSRREGYDVRIVDNKSQFKNEIVKEGDTKRIKELTGVNDLIYVDNRGKLCCTETLEGAITLIKYNESV